FGATNASLTISSVQLFSDSVYNVVVFNPAGAVVSSNAALVVLIPATILTQPQSVSVFPSNTITFSVTAVSNSSIRYQWRFNGADISGATNASLSITNVQPNQDGQYAVVVTDSVGPVVSSTARLMVLVQPQITVQPTNRTV